VIRQTAFKDVEAVMTARFDLAETLANGAHGHSHHGAHAVATNFQLLMVRLKKQKTEID
jgi:hypothetical protein